MPFSRTAGTPKLIQVEPEAHRRAKVAAMLAGKDMKTWVSDVIKEAAEKLQREMGISAPVGARILNANATKRGGAKPKGRSR